MELIEEDPVFNKFAKKDFEMTAIFRNFSSSKHSGWENSGWEFYKGVGDDRTMIFPVEEDIPGFSPWFFPRFYADGNCKENEGYVSITFKHITNIPKDGEFRCHVSVVDVSRNKRFTQSIVVLYDDINPLYLREYSIFGLERYIKRETLLSDPGELLPGDCLTVSVDSEYIDHTYDHLFDKSLKETETSISRDEYNRECIFLDKRFGRDLCRESEYFRVASVSPFIESRMRSVRIVRGEMYYFQEIFNIFYGAKLDPQNVINTTISDIWELYHVAYKYDIPSVIETCRQFVKALLCTVDNPECRKSVDDYVPEFLELADHYRDDDIKDAIVTYMESKENFGSDLNALGQHLEEKLYTEWKCSFNTGTKPIVTPCIIMKRRSPIVDPEFEFYQ